VDFRRNSERSRFELLEDGEVVAFAEYLDQGEVVVFPHTVVVAHLRGRGIGAELVRKSLDEVRVSGKLVIATCWYVAEFIDANPEYQDLRAA
jgi:predicted GNAT family acetyltransferase